MAVKDFLPSWAREVVDIPEDGEVATRHARLDMLKWVVAFDNLALAYAANDVSYRHKVFRHKLPFPFALCRFGPTLTPRHTFVSACK